MDCEYVLEVEFEGGMPHSSIEKAKQLMESIWGFWRMIYTHLHSIPGINGYK